MQPADLDAVMQIEREIYEFPWTSGNFRDSLAAGYRCWLYESDREIIGYAVVIHAAGEAHLLNLSIAASLQRKGYGGRKGCGGQSGCGGPP
jgi:ribosomal-protein-alanine N-acetyltransferase